MTTVTLNFPDGVLDRADLTERKLRVELACALFAQRKLTVWPAAQLAGLSRAEIEDELAGRNIPLYYIDEEYWEQEKKALESMRRPRRQP